MVVTDAEDATDVDPFDGVLGELQSLNSLHLSVLIDPVDRKHVLLKAAKSLFAKLDTGSRV